MKHKKIKFKSLDTMLGEALKGDKQRQISIQIEHTKALVAEKLVEIREKIGLTQKELAQKMKISQQLISKVESGADNITLATLVKFLLILGVCLKIEVEKRKKDSGVLEFV